MSRVFFFLLWASMSMLNGQISFEAEINRDHLSMDESLVLNYIIRSETAQAVNSQELNLNFPDLQDFTVLSTQNWNEDVQVNGTRQQSFVLSLVLKPNRTGTLKIPPAGLTYHNERLRAPSFEVVVGRNSTQSPSQPMDSDRMKKGFLSFEISNTTPYQNENLLGELIFYAVNPFYLENVRKFIPANFSGFSSEFIEFDNSVIYQKRINGKTYYARTLYKVLLSPNKSGRMTIDPSSAEVLVGDGFYGHHMQTIQSGKVKLNVAELPANAPKNFTGAVGDFELVVEKPNEKIEAHKSFSLGISLKGKGNFTFVKMPKIETDKSIEYYKPSSEKKIRITEQGEQGEWLQKNVLVAQQEGVYPIKVGAFSYFNPQTGKYIEIAPQQFELDIAAGDGAYQAYVSPYTDPNLPSDSNLSEDSESNNISDSSQSHWWAWVGGATTLIALAFIGLLVWIRKQQKDEVIRQKEPQELVISDEPKQIQAPFRFEDITQAYQRGDISEFYRGIEQMLNQKELRHTDSEQFGQDKERITKKLRQLKYSPLQDAQSQKELWEVAQDWNRKYLV